MRIRTRVLLAAAAVVGASIVVPVGHETLEAQSTTPTSTSTLLLQTPLLQPAGSEAFGEHVTVLSNGNFVVADPLWDDGGITDVGAVYLYDGATNLVVTALTGSQANDRVGSGGLVEVGDSNVVVASPHWGGDVGASTWMSGEAGTDGPVTATNSLRSSTEGSDPDGPSFGTNLTVLANGNYVIVSRYQTTSGTYSAATWADGNTAATGTVSITNSLIATEGSAGDIVPGGGGTTVTPLVNGNYVVASRLWTDGSVQGLGAATWADGANGITGPVTTTNSLHGSSSNDFIGTVTALTNGNYVVASEQWDSATHVNVGAVVLGDGVGGSTVGAVTTANSLHGSTTNDGVGSVTALTNGNFVVTSDSWNDGSIFDAGAATWVDGVAGLVGPVTTDNSLHGTTVNDQVGRGTPDVVALANGNYVVGSYLWNFGTIREAGAATWGDGATGITGPVTTTNSLHGTTRTDHAGQITALTNGNYVVSTPSWNMGSIYNAGAVTWADGTSGVSGPITTENSLHGSSVDDQVGGRGSTALTNGNFVALSRDWDNNGPRGHGAATWIDGSEGLSGPVSTTNSFYGGYREQVGASGFRLSNGNLIVGSSEFDSPFQRERWALTLMDGAVGLVGQPAESNSFFQLLTTAFSSDYDGELRAVQELPGGHVLVQNRDQRICTFAFECSDFEPTTSFMLSDRPVIGPLSPSNTIAGHWQGSERVTAAGAVLLYRPGGVITFGPASAPNTEFLVGVATSELAPATRQGIPR